MKIAYHWQANGRTIYITIVISLVICLMATNVSLQPCDRSKWLEEILADFYRTKYYPSEEKPKKVELSIDNNYFY